MQVLCSWIRAANKPKLQVHLSCQGRSYIENHLSSRFGQIWEIINSFFISLSLAEWLVSLAKPLNGTWREEQHQEEEEDQGASSISFSCFRWMR